MSHGDKSYSCHKTDLFKREMLIYDLILRQVYPKLPG